MSSLASGHPRPQLHLRALAVVAVVGLIALGLVSTLARGTGGTAPSPASAPAGSGAGSVSAPLSAPLARMATASPTRRVEVIVQLVHGTNPAAGAALVRSLGGRPGAALPIINGLSARLSAAGARRLAASPLVRVVSLNAAIRTQDQGATQPPAPWALGTTFDQSVNATALWQHTTGQGVGVAVIDTGITGNLQDFRGSSNQGSRVVASAVIDPGASTANDTYGHGTLVAGLIGGNGNYRSRGDVHRQYAGTAPNANLISVKVADDSGQSTILDAIYGLQFAVDHRDQYNIRVANLSFRSTTPGSYKTDPLDAAVEQAWLHGIVVVAAAGNMGTTSDAVSYAPGNDPYALTVGGVDEQGTKDPSDDVTASWSSQGTTQDGFTKPDVLAPGAHIISTLAPGSDFASSCPSCVVDGGYFQASGTSLAAPIVAGIAADLVAAHPGWTPAQVKGAIVNTASPISDGGHEVDAAAANAAGGDQLTSDQNLEPSTLIDPSTGSIDYSTASWSTASWSTATNPLTASWSTASWSCLDCSDSSGGNVDPQTASWSTLGWTTMWG